MSGSIRCDFSVLIRLIYLNNAIKRSLREKFTSFITSSKEEKGEVKNMRCEGLAEMLYKV
jgi:hypothetical protein